MNKMKRAIYEIQSLDALANENRWVNRLHPLVKLCVTILYIGITVSFPKYNLSSLLVMAVYPIILFVTGDISFWEGIRRLRVVLPLVCVVGIFNPFFDREIMIQVGNVNISGGVLSMLTLMIKGIFTVFASYLLIATTTIEKICYALRILHLPKIFVTQILLIYRYISVLLSEANRITQAYALRAPGQKGIHFKVWGSLVGQMLLRSMDRAEDIYEGMCLRGYQGEFYYGSKIKVRWTDMLYLCIWATLFSALRFLPVSERIGSMFV